MHRLTVMLKFKYALNLTPGQCSVSFVGKSWKGLSPCLQSKAFTPVSLLCQPSANNQGSTYVHLLIEAKKMTESQLILGERLFPLLQQKGG